MGPIGYVGPMRPSIARLGSCGCLCAASERADPFVTDTSEMSLPTEPRGSIRVDADNKPLLWANHDVLR
jgi:hypothetical protein